MFLVYFHGEQLSDRVHKMCNAFNITLYECPENLEERMLLKNTINVHKKDVKIVSIATCLFNGITKCRVYPTLSTLQNLVEKKDLNIPGRQVSS